MCSKTFVGSALPKIERHGDIWLVPAQVGGVSDIFLPQFEVVYSKWDSIVRQQQTAPKRMKSFGETNKAKKLKSNGSRMPEESKNDPKSNPNDENPSKSIQEVTEARERLKKRFGKSPAKETPEKTSVADESAETLPKNRRTWHKISEKIDKRDMDKIDMSAKINGADDSASQAINIEAEMEKYLGGDDEVLKGFLDSDEEPAFDAINPLEKEAGAGARSIFSRLASAFGNVTGNK